MAGLGLWRPSAWASTDVGRPRLALSGTEFDLTIGETLMNVTGAPRFAVTVNGGVPAPTLRWREGDTVTLRVTNTLSEDTSIHWHGILLPANMDGVPGLSFNGIRPGETHTYRFTVRQGGTYWYHSHSGFQEQRGLYGALIVEPRELEPFSYDRDHVVMLSDWTDEDPDRVFAKLKKQAHYYNFNRRTVGDFVRDVRERGFGSTVSDRLAWGDMRMTPTDLADVTGATYTYLMNGHAPAGNWTGLFQPGERVRLRFVNGGAASYFDVRIPGLKMTVVAADGQHVHPVTVDEFRIASGETFDVLVEPSGQEAFTIYAQSMDRTGHACGTLALREGLGLEGRCRDFPPHTPSVAGCRCLNVSLATLFAVFTRRVRLPPKASPRKRPRRRQARRAPTWWASPSGLDATDTGRWRAGRCSDMRRGAGAGAARRRGWALSTTACRTDADGRRSARSPTRRRGPARRAARPLSRRSTAWPRPPRDVGVGVVHPRALTLGVGGMGGCGLVAVASFSSPSCQSLNRP